MEVPREEGYGNVIDINSNLCVSSHKQNSSMENREIDTISRRRERSITDKDTQAHININVTGNEDSELHSDLQDESRWDGSSNTYQTNQCIPYKLIGLMYQLDLSILCILRKYIYKHKYPSLSLAFEDSTINKFNNIILRYKKKSIHLQIENVDTYYIDNDISYARLFTQEKRSFSLNNYLDNFVKHLISELNNLSNDIEYLIIYTNSGLNLTEEKRLKQGRFKNFYPFRFTRMRECDTILRDFLLTNDNMQQRGFYQFAQDKTIRNEFLKRLKFSFTTEKVIKERGLCQKEIKTAFLNKLVFAVNQPNREELNSIIKSEMEKDNEVQDDYVALQKRVLRDLIASKNNRKLGNYISEVTYGFNLLMSFLHNMFLHRNMSSINFEEQNYGISLDVTIDYKDIISYIKVHNTNDSIGYNQLFPSKRQERKNTFSINKCFTLFIEKLQKDKNMKYFIIYTNANLNLPEKNKFKKVQSKDFYPLEFEKVDIKKKEYAILRGCFCINVNGLYKFSQKETTMLLNLLKLPCFWQKEIKEGKFSGENEKGIKKKFLDRLIFAVNQHDNEGLNSIIRNKIDKSNVQYNWEELHEIALRWLESHEFGPITKEIMEQLLEDIQNNRFSYRGIQENIDEEIKFARGVVGRERTPAFYQFLNFLIKGEGKIRLEVLNKKSINLANISSILHVTGANATKAFNDLYDLWIDEEENETQYLKTLNKEKINLVNISSVLGGSGANAAKAFKDLYDLWFDEKGSKTQYLKTLDKEEINLTNISSILSGAGVNAAKAFKDLYVLWFDEEGNKTQRLKTLEEDGINLNNISTILNVAGANAAKTFICLYDLWFNKKGSKTQYLNTLEKEGVCLFNMFSILHGAGAKAPKAFEDLYDLWFDEKGTKRQYFETLEREGMNLSSMSSILNGAGANAAKAFKDLYEFWFNAEGIKKQCLEHFIDGKNKNENFMLHNLSSILSRTGSNAKDAFEKLHNVCFDDKGQKTKLLEDFYNAGFRPSNLSSLLSGTGTHASFALKRLHNIFFKNGKETQLLRDFINAGFKPRDLCGILNSATNSIKEFHNFCFTKKTKKYLYRFLNEKDGFTPKRLSKILHGAGTKICSALKDFHDICFDKKGNKTQLLNDFDKAGFMPSHLSKTLSMAGGNATSILRNFHKSCFNEKDYLNHFLAEKDLFAPNDLSKILYGVGLSICRIFEKLHDLCFDKAGNKTDYLNNLIKDNSLDEIPNILKLKSRKKLKKAPSAFFG